MKITFFSNFLNHHQLPFCLEMYNLIGNDFKFIATEPINEERLNMGYADMSELYPFSLNTYKDSYSFMEGIRYGNESDVVIIGSSPSVFVKSRLIEDKITFRYNERVFKKGQWRVLWPKTFFSLYKNHIKYKNRNVYMLCASAYTACDFNLIGAYENKTYKWGYFPEVKEFNIDELFSKKEKCVPKLLWVGRFIDLKHPEHAIILANMLKEHNYDFTLDIIGTGVMENHLKNLIRKYGLEDKVKILGSMKPEKVREHMESSDIYLFTSDFNEGWGAVLNESMNSGCAVVASHAIGSVPFLMRNEENGLVYKNRDLEDLFRCVKRLIDDEKLRKHLGMAAYKTMLETWNPKIAAERLIVLFEKTIRGEKFYFEDGPCSKAENIKEREMYNYLMGGKI